MPSPENTRGTLEAAGPPAVTAAQLALLHHTLGLSPHQRGASRNHFLSGPGHHAEADLQALVAAGYLTRRQAPSWACSDELFQATREGCTYANANLPPLPEPVKRTRYQEYRAADLGCTFAEWLGVEVPRREYQGRQLRLVSSKATGGWGGTLKEAKALYKQALAARRAGARPALPT